MRNNEALGQAIADHTDHIYDAAPGRGAHACTKDCSTSIIELLPEGWLFDFRTKEVWQGALDMALDAGFDKAFDILRHKAEQEGHTTGFPEDGVRSSQCQICMAPLCKYIDVFLRRPSSTEQKGQHIH